MKPLHRRHEVILDLADLYAWIGQRDPDAAERFLLSVDSTFEQIQKHPGIGWGASLEDTQVAGYAFVES